MILCIVLIIALVLAIFLVAKIKRLRYGNLTLITGGVKTGKTELSVALAIKRYRKQFRKWRRDCKLAIKRCQSAPEQPLLYSNMPIGKPGMKYCPITLDHMTGKTRFAYGSVVYFNEISFIAGSSDFRDDEINDYLLKFFKLCAHFTKGGYFFIDTQSPQDTHFAVKRSLSTYLTIYRRLTLPFVSILWVRENILVDGENTVALDTQIDTQDSVDNGGKPFYVLPILNKWWRYYDRYAYSFLVDDLPVGKDEVLIKSQKANVLLRIRDIVNKGGKNGKIK